MRKIICIGNLLIPEDSAGPEMFASLQAVTLPDDVELIDGGTRGLDLLSCFDGASQVILIDQVSGFGATSGVAVLTGDQLQTAVERRLDHQTGIGYLLRLLPQVCEHGVPEVQMVGIEGCLNEEKKQKCQQLLQQLISR